MIAKILERGFAPVLFLFLLLPFGARAAGVAIMVTRDSEAQQVLERLEGSASNMQCAARTVNMRHFRGLPVAVVKARPGIVNAALTAQMLADRCAPDLVISVGLCAAVSDSLPRAALVLPRFLERHDVGTHTDAGFMHGIAYARGARAELELAVGNPDGWRRLLARLDAAGVSAREGCLATGDSFIRSAHKRQWIREKLGADIVDASGAAIGAVCRDNGLPCVILRQVSDCGDAAAGDQFAEFAGWADDALARAAVAVMEWWLAEAGQ